MPSQTDSVYGVVVSWYDPQPMISREYILKYFPDEKHVEMYDIKARRTFLRKSPAPPHINETELYVGNEIVLHSRSLKVVKYADSATEAKLSASQATSVAFLSPGAYSCRKVGTILEALTKKCGLSIKQLKMVAMVEAEGEEMSRLLYADEALPQHAALWASGPSVAVVVIGANAVAKLASFVSSHDGGKGPEPFIACAPTPQAAQLLMDFAFGTRSFARSPTAKYGDCTCCVIRPHAVKSGDAGGIIALIEAAGYDITAMALFNLDVPAAAEFLEVYDGVIPGFDDSVRELSASACIAMELRGPPNCCAAFRETAGPWDVDFARELRPETIRAKYGKDRLQNAVHCTDLPEDAELECQYFFEVLKS